MSEQDRTYEFGDSLKQMTPEEFDSFQLRLFNFMFVRFREYEQGGYGPDDESLAFSKLTLSGILSDLKSDLVAPDYETEDGYRVYENLPKYSLIPVAPIVDAPTLALYQKTDLLALYPSMLVISGVALTKSGARARVKRALRETRPRAPEAKIERRNLVEEVELRWRADRVQRFLYFFGLIPREDLLT